MRNSPAAQSHARAGFRIAVTPASFEPRSSSGVDQVFESTGQPWVALQTSRVRNRGFSHAIRVVAEELRVRRCDPWAALAAAAPGVRTPINTGPGPLLIALTAIWSERPRRCWCDAQLARCARLTLGLFITEIRSRKAAPKRGDQPSNRCLTAMFGLAMPAPTLAVLTIAPPP